MLYKDLKIEKNSMTAFTGSGGKTSLMFTLADELSQAGKVLVTTTTKIHEPEKSQYENLFLVNGEKIFKGTGKNIDILGMDIEDGKLVSEIKIENKKIENKKIEEEILKIKSNYDFILYEADGAKEKPMKFWNENEPCILKETDMVIGVGNIKVLGMEYSEKNVHRFNVYMDSNKIIKKIIDEEILRDYLLNGKFFRIFDENKNYKNFRKIRFLNGVENDDELMTAMKLAEDIPDFIFGSVREKKIYTPREISAVVMGSGESKRFGQNKLLYKIDGVPMIEILIKKLVSLPFKKIFVTYKNEDKEILKICEKYKVVPLKNEKYYLGQSESVKLGAGSIENEAVMFFTGDMPFLSEKTITKLMGEFYREEFITIPRVNGQRFSPVIFPNRYKSSLMGLTGDTGGREIIKKEKDINFVEFEDIKEFVDIDTEDELKNLKNNLKIKGETDDK